MYGTFVVDLWCISFFPCFPKEMVWTIAVLALRPRGRVADQERRDATVVVHTLFPWSSICELSSRYQMKVTMLTFWLFFLKAKNRCKRPTMKTHS